MVVVDDNSVPAPVGDPASHFWPGLAVIQYEILDWAHK